MRYCHGPSLWLRSVTHVASARGHFSDGHALGEEFIDFFLFNRGKNHTVSARLGKIKHTVTKRLTNCAILTFDRKSLREMYKFVY